MSTTVSHILSRVESVLNDPDEKILSTSERLAFLNEAIKAVVRRVPSAYTSTMTVTLAPGARQQLPSDGVALVSVRRNVTAGRAMTPFNMEAMDAVLPGWQFNAPDSPRQWSYNPAVPTVFWVYPPHPSGGTAEQVEIEYSRLPEDVGIGDRIPLDHRWDDALVDFVLYRAFSQDSEYGSDGGRAVAHYQRFVEATSG